MKMRHDPSTREVRKPIQKDGERFLKGKRGEHAKKIFIRSPDNIPEEIRLKS